MIARCWRWLLLMVLLGIAPGGQASTVAGGHAVMAASEQAVLVVPVSFAGAALILLGLAFMIAELVRPITA